MRGAARGACRANSGEWARSLTLADFDLGAKISIIESKILLILIWARNFTLADFDDVARGCTWGA